MTLTPLLATDGLELEFDLSGIKELTNTHEPVQEIMMVFLISETRTTIPIFLFLIQNIDCGYPLERRRGGSNVFPQSMFGAKKK